ncbi:uncharacterized protein [Haliotis cracherodii]|uniref:uncharacterized protein n=1 Tax=Haliotis cracherodii TaxID=6455 RepID=UPI0039EB3AB2
MSLLLLKTKNLSWQDHTMNVEVMLSPNHSQLLFNKHKTLGTQYIKEVDLYQKQISTLVKDITVEKRLMARYHTRLVSRQKELIVQRSHSAQEMRRLQQLDMKDRSRSAPVGSSRGSSPPRPLGRKSRGVFLTEIEEDKMSKLPALPSKRKKIQTIVVLPKTLEKPKPKPKPPNLGPKRFVTFGERPPSDSESEESEEEEAPETAYPLEEKIKNFLDEVKSFNEKPVPKRQLQGSAELFRYLKENESAPTSPVGKRYNTLTLDRQRLETAFDSFCKSKSREDLVKMMRLAAKMKANVAQARNTPMVPTMSAMKSSRAFLSMKANAASPSSITSPT